MYLNEYWLENSLTSIIYIQKDFDCNSFSSLNSRLPRLACTGSLRTSNQINNVSYFMKQIKKKLN